MLFRSLVLIERDSAFDERLGKNWQLSPERRARRLLTQLEKDEAAGG